MKKKLKHIIDWIVFLLAGNGPIAKKSVDEGLCDFSGQGRDQYGN